MFRANIQRNGAYQTSGVRQLRGIKWKFQPSPDNASLIPGWNWHLAIGEEILCVNSPGGNLYGLDSQTGQQLWVCQLGKEKRIFSPTIAEGTIYILSRQTGKPIADEFLHAIDVHSGQQRWQFSLQPLSPSSAFIESFWPAYSPAVIQGIAYIGGRDGNLSAIDVASGELIWSFATTKNMPLTSPAIDDEIVCICCHDGYLYAIDLTTRQKRWQFEIGALSRSIPSVPAIANNRVFVVSTDNTLHALNLQTGESLWTFNQSNQPFYYPAIADGIVCINNSERILYALDVETGQERWRFTPNELQFCSSPIIANETVYVGAKGGLQALKLETGKPLWQFQVPFSDLWILNPQMWIFGLLNQVEKAFTGEIHNLEKFSSPVIADEIVYVNCSNGYFYALH